MDFSEEQILCLLQQITDKSVQRDGERAIEALYLEFNRPVRNFIWKSITQDSELIEEIVQDTFFEVWKNPERFRRESKFKTWLLGIARHKALDSLRKNGKKYDPIDDIIEVTESEEMPITDMIQKEQIQKAVNFCLESLFVGGKLSASHKEVLHLAYVEDQDIDEIALIQGCPESTIKTRLHYARMRITNCLKKRLIGGLELG